jgi:hypothetical protein
LFFKNFLQNCSNLPQFLTSPITSIFEFICFLISGGDQGSDEKGGGHSQEGGQEEDWEAHGRRLLRRTQKEEQHRSHKDGNQGWKNTKSRFVVTQN